MRNNYVVRKVTPCLAVILAMSLHAEAAQAGLVDSLLKQAASYFNTQTPQKVSPVETKVADAEAKSQTSFAEEQKVFSIEKDLIGKVISDITDAPESRENINRNLRRSSLALAERVELVNTPTHTELMPEYTADGLIIRLRYDEKALENPKLLMKDLAILVTFYSRGYGRSMKSNVFTGRLSDGVHAEVESLHSIAELLTNVREGSPTAKARWLSLQSRLLADVGVDSAYMEHLNLDANVISDIRTDLTLQLEKANEEAAKHARKQQKIQTQWKTETGALEKFEAMQEKLDDLILKNDRKGVRQMLESYLPWATMEPVEANTWKIWLDAIENPDPAKTTVAFRGLKYDTDKVQRRQTSQGEVYGFMSTVLTKNQGSYTRRLRSLSTNREKNGDQGFAGNGGKNMSVKVTDQMTAHARNPVASSFISFTYAPDVARRFMGEDQTKSVNGKMVEVPFGGILVVKMDSRRMVPNISSMYANEIELLAPLIVFPDEVVKYKEGSFNNDYTYENFIKEISEKTGIDFTKGAYATTGEETLRLRYNREGHEFLKQMNHVQLKAVSCSKIF